MTLVPPNTPSLELDQSSLRYNGSHLGEFDAQQVLSYIQPCNNFNEKRELNKKNLIFFALFKYRNHKYPVVVKRNYSKRPDQALIDQIKPLFGLKKMGCHRVRFKNSPVKKYPNGPVLHMGQINIEFKAIASEYYIFQAGVNSLPDQVPNYRQLIPLACYPFSDPDYQLKTPEQQKILKSLRQICMFRELIGVSETNMGDILVNPSDNESLLSIDEMAMNPSREEKSASTLKRSAFTRSLKEILFPTEMIGAQTCLSMIRAHNHDYLEILDRIRDSMYRIFSEIDSQKNWMVPIIVDNFKSYIEIGLAYADQLEPALPEPALG